MPQPRSAAPWCIGLDVSTAVFLEQRPETLAAVKTSPVARPPGRLRSSAQRPRRPAEAASTTSLVLGQHVGGVRAHL